MEYTFEYEINGVTISFDGYYSKGEPDEPYDRYGEPGTQGTPSTFQIQEAHYNVLPIGTLDILPVLHAFEIDLEDIEEKAIEEIES